jgi:hypothetical protein
MIEGLDRVLRLCGLVVGNREIGIKYPQAYEGKEVMMMFYNGVPP